MIFGSWNVVKVEILFIFFEIQHITKVPRTLKSSKWMIRFFGLVEILYMLEFEVANVIGSTLYLLILRDQ